MANEAINPVGKGREALANDKVVGVLNDLLENAHDGEYGFRVCADEVDASSALKRVFGERAVQCRVAGNELAALIAQYGGTPAEGGSATGAMHRGWVHVKAAVGANSELSMLEECERGEDAAVARYRKALKQDLPIDVLALVQRQADGAQRNHDQIRDLRDQVRARK
ncbi:ferritin-like domain-containing protein [Variovorax sp. PAMC 28711]|uniref:ferritin-like domain-containing protein n=1 Tax=Variovorax sp. PAMC 28711 TaxID=1795631 RepID=UPI00078B28DE|nr:PA2169 family four-helix-bundle protein [Variovorax sp. PAMC 28711]AMM23407.1 aldehyde dehydrogenase [Variovorax sp. PAMC 28711]